MSDDDQVYEWFDPLDPAPPYRQIAAILRRQIESGQLAPGDVLPSEKRLQQEFGVARETARRAVRVLREEGLTITIPGRGTYVKPDR